MVYDDISLESFMHNYVGKNKPFKGRVAQLGKVQYVDLSGQYIQVLDDYGKVKPAFYDRVRLPQNLCHTFIPDNTRVSNRDMWLGQEPYKRDSIKSNKSNYDWGYARGATLDASSLTGDFIEDKFKNYEKYSVGSRVKGMVTSKVIPAVIKFGKFSNWVSYGMLGRNFMKEGRKRVLRFAIW